MRIRIFDRYIWGQVFSSTLTGVLVLTGVMVLGSVYQKLDQLLGDTKVPIWVVLKFIALTVPYSLIFTLPCAFLTGILLVFGRMSADNEMVSLRMTGQPMWRICMPIFLHGRRSVQHLLVCELVAGTDGKEHRQAHVLRHRDERPNQPLP